MPKEWILNMATNRWGLNKKRKVGPVSLWIRECAPKSLDEWMACYRMRLQKFLKDKGISLTPDEYLASLGEKLYVKITEVLAAEIEEVTKEDCIDYIKNLVFKRTFEGYNTEIKTIYGQLEKELGIKIKPASDELDRSYNVDFVIPIGDKLIGIQIKPVSYRHLPDIHRWRQFLSKTHKKFQNVFGGKVFIVFSVKRGNKKEILNPEVIEEIRSEVERLRELTAK